MREVIAELLLREIKDPRVDMVSISEVDVSPDLRNARVYFSCIGDDEHVTRAQRGLESAAGFVRSQLSKRLQMRHAPELRFQHDESFKRAEHLAGLLRGAGSGAGSGD